MYIDRILPPQYAPLPSVGPENSTIPNTEMSPNDFSAPERFPARVPSGGVVVDISPEGRAAYKRSLPVDENRRTGAVEAAQPRECQTCKNRKYQDASDDPSVSFQAPTHISPGAAPSVVASHEREHVSHEQAKAMQDGRRIVSQTVALKTAMCPECGRIYVSGGVTHTLTATDRSGEQTEKMPSVEEGPEPQ
jgi:hypothetical protein